MLKYIGIGKPTAAISLRPHRTVDIACDYDGAFAKVLQQIELTLGANVYEQDRERGLIECGFGVVNNERIRCTFDRGDSTTTVHIEAHFRAGAATPEKSAAVDALARSLGNAP